jgi:hypothetical protein
MSRKSASRPPRKASVAPLRSRTPGIGRRERHRLDVRARLFRAAIELFGVRGFTAVEEARAGRDPICAILRRWHGALVSEAAETQQFAASMLVTMISSIPVRQLACARMEEGRALGAELMAIGQKRGEVRNDIDPAELYFVFQQVAFGAVFFFALKDVGNRDKYFKSSFDLFWSGIEAHPPSRVQGTRHHGK